MSSADAFALENSMLKTDTTPDFNSKYWTFMNDQNNLNYGTKQVIFDLSGFFNSQRFIDLAEMILVIPIVTTLSPDDLFQNKQTWVLNPTQTMDGLGVPQPTAAADLGSYEPSQLWAMGFKSGYWNLIYNMSVNVDGIDCVQLTPNINYIASFEAATKWSQSDIAKHGPMCGFLPDDELSWGINPTKVGNANGYGVYNNSLPPDHIQDSFPFIAGQTAITNSTGVAVSGFVNVKPSNSFGRHLNNKNRCHVNRALYERMNQINFYNNPVSQGQQKGTADEHYLVDPKLICQSISDKSSSYTASALADGCFMVNPTADNNTSSARVWMTTCIIRFKDICPMFNELPISRCMYIRLVINVNTGHMAMYQPNYLVEEPYGGSAAAYGPGNAADDLKNMPYLQTTSANLASVQKNGILQVPNPVTMNTAVTSTFTGTSSGTPTGTIANTIPAGLLAMSVPAGISAGVARVLDTPSWLTYSGATVAGPNAGLTYVGSDAIVSTGVKNFPVISATVTDSPLLVAQLPKFGYGAIYENSFEYTCPVMLAQAVSSYYTNNPPTNTSAGSGVGTATYGLVNQKIEYNPLPGLNCGYYSQYRNGLRLSVAIAKPESTYHPLVSGLSSYAHGLQCCRVYAPTIEMEPSKSVTYLNAHKEQEVRYGDYLSFSLLNVPPAQQFSWQVANGISNMDRITVIPYFQDDTTPQGAAVTTGTGYSNVSGTAAPGYYNFSCPSIPYEPRSPFDSAPSTTAPMGYIRNYQVQIANSNLWPRNQDYNFENFLEECSEANAINGGLDTGLTSGLIDYRKWNNNYRYYTANVSRRLAGDNTQKAVNLSGVNDTLYPMDIICYIRYIRSYTLNVLTGRVSS